jgi:hypothetical protein
VVVVITHLERSRRWFPLPAAAIRTEGNKGNEGEIWVRPRQFHHLPLGCLRFLLFEAPWHQHGNYSPKGAKIKLHGTTFAPLPSLRLGVNDLDVHRSKIHGGEDQALITGRHKIWPDIN